MKKAFVLTLSLLFVFSFSIGVFAESSNTGSLENAGSDFGGMITDIIGKFGGEADVDYSGIFSGIGALGDIDIGGYLSNINIESLGEDLQAFMGNFLNFDDISLDGIGNIFNDLGMGDLSSMLTEGLDGFIGIGGEGGGLGNIGEGGLTDFFSGVAGSIADMTGDFDIAEFIDGLISGSGSGSSNNDTNQNPQDVNPPTNPPSVNLGGGGSSTIITPNTPVVTTPEEDEVETQEFTTQTGIIYKPVENNDNEINEPVKEKNTNKIIAGVILVLGSFGTVAYLVIKKVI